jgi:CRISPR-associated protein Cmr3
MSVETRFLEPLDVLFLRGNKLFGDPGSFGEALIPPWPSVAAGAIRSRMLADDGVDPAAFARGEVVHPELGTPREPGAFTLTAFQLARRQDDDRVEALYPLPSDVVVREDAAGKATVQSITPTPLPEGEGLQSSAPLPLLPVLAESERGKPASGYWLTETGWRDYLAGKTPDATGLVHSGQLWTLDHRVGVGLEAATRRAADGRLFSVQAVAMRPGVGFLTAVHGARPPSEGAVRLGGDGRAAAIRPLAVELPEPDYAAIAQAGRCRLVLATPGLFSAGWLPTGMRREADGSYRFDLHGVQARLVCAAVPRAEVVSGWDLARWQPKPAQRATPMGSVWWLDELQATPEALCKLAEAGLWSEPCEDAARRAEGFNRVTLAAWNEGLCA